MTIGVRSTSTIHQLKCLAGYFGEVWAGRKTFELRFDDRGYAVGDTLQLHEVVPGPEDTVQYTGRRVDARVTYLLRGPAFGLAEGWVIMSIAVIWCYATPPDGGHPQATPGQS